jgi:hypothetical protein
MTINIPQWILIVLLSLPIIVISLFFLWIYWLKNFSDKGEK